MKTAAEVLEILGARIDLSTLDEYISREWLRPIASDEEGWLFEEIDIARLELVCHLMQDISVNDEGMEIVLSLLDQLYGTRTHVETLKQAIAQQPTEIQTDIKVTIETLIKTE